LAGIQQEGYRPVSVANEETTNKNRLFGFLLSVPVLILVPVPSTGKDKKFSQP
jgi:hypothetical protein